MIEVVKEGRKDGGNFYVGTCTNCGCEIKCQEEDVSEEIIRQTSSTNGTTTWYGLKVKCPNEKCPFKITVNMD